MALAIVLLPLATGCGKPPAAPSGPDGLQVDRYVAGHEWFLQKGTDLRFKDAGEFKNLPGASHALTWGGIHFADQSYQPVFVALFKYPGQDSQWTPGIATKEKTQVVTWTNGTAKAPTAFRLDYVWDGSTAKETCTVGDKVCSLEDGRALLVDLTADPPTLVQLKTALPPDLPREDGSTSEQRAKMGVFLNKLRADRPEAAKHLAK
jgi:hypothetical protein